jgi:2-polyprenyl-6-methoxyphenol hydroxylase-like FAD-dependent oxidoreductase
MSQVVIQGAGIAGCALALLLAREGHGVTVVERASAPRSGGQAVDVRGAALKVVEQMGLAADIRARRTKLRGMSVYDEGGREIETTTERTLGRSQLDSEDIELFRDDLAKILLEETEKHVEYCFGGEIASLRENDAGIAAHLVSGERRMVDLVVGADGLRSGVRRLAFGPDDVHVRPLGIYAGVYTAPNRIALQDWQIVFRTPDRGAIIYPTRDNSELRVALYFATRDAGPAAHDTAAQRRALKAHLEDIGGPIGTMIKELDRAEDLYADGMAQVRMDTWSRGRVALVGDAAFCPSPLTGQGTSLALVGAYALARELAGSVGHEAALARYEKRLRPFVVANQDIDIRTGEGIDEAKNAFDFDA